MTIKRLRFHFKNLSDVVYRVEVKLYVVLVPKLPFLSDYNSTPEGSIEHSYNLRIMYLP